jgi:hypothetical protein
LGIYFAIGELSIGENTSESAVATVFQDSTSGSIVWENGLVETGFHKLRFNLGSATTDIDITGWTFDCIGQKDNDGDRGYTTTEDSRLQVEATGTSGALNLIECFLRNTNSVTLTSVVVVDTCDIQCELLTQASAEITDSVIRTTSVTQVATLQDPTFGASDLHDTEFIQDGAGHAIELDTATTYTFANLGFTGYGGTPGTNSTPSSGANDAAILNSSGGAVTINISGGDVPSVRNTASSTTTVVATVDYNLVGMNDGTELTILDRDVSMLDVNVGGSNANIGDAAATERSGQSFQVAATAKAERVRLRLRKVGTPTDGISVRLVNGVPGSTLLAESVVIAGSTLTTSYVEYDIDLTEKNSLTLATTYGIEIQRTGAVDGSNYYQVEYDSTGTHGSGTRYNYNAGWGTASGDLWFSIMEAASDNELFHVESSSGIETYAHGGVVKEVEVLAMHTNFIAIVVIDTLAATDTNVTLTQTPDRVFSNP